jgi:phosphoribosylaminoimidazolecarboxamide formyltransferase / IMP cyclohydrolase
MKGRLLMTDLVPVRRALISVSDKSGLDGLATALAGRGVELISTGGTAAKLRENGAEPRDISELTGFPEMMDGRVKTLHPKVHGGLLAIRTDSEHSAAMDEHGIVPIDLVIVNLYPFEATLMRGAGRDEIIENIDIGGPAMVRSAAKNHAFVACVTDPSDYDELIAELDRNDGATSLDFRKQMAAKAFALTAAYDSMISQWFAFGDQKQRWPQSWTFSSKLAMPLRYGENPHQEAALYIPARARDRPGRAGAGEGAELQQSQ